MSDLIFYTNGEENFRIPSPFSNNYYHLPKCPETKLEIKMTEQKFTLELTLDELKLIDKHLWISVATKPILEKIKNAYPKPDVIEIDGVKYQRIEEPTKPMDEVVERLVKKYQAQKLYNRLYDELGYDFEDIENIVSLVEDWLPEPQSAAGSQNVNTELLVDGFNDCVRKMKEMLR